MLVIPAQHRKATCFLSDLQNSLSFSNNLYNAVTPLMYLQVESMAQMKVLLHGFIPFPFHSIQLFFLHLNKVVVFFSALTLSYITHCLISHKSARELTPVLVKVSKALKICLTLWWRASLVLMHLHEHYPTDTLFLIPAPFRTEPSGCAWCLMHKEYEYSKIQQLSTLWLYHVGCSGFTWKRKINK